MQLSDMIERLEDDRGAAEIIGSLGDPGLLMAMHAIAADHGVALGEYAAWLVRTYADNASPDQWTTLIGDLARADDPGAVWLRRAFSEGQAMMSSSTVRAAAG